MNRVLIAGLGNPGEKYAATRHNIGARIVTAFAGERNFPGSIKVYLPRKEFLRGLPAVFMNESGRAVKSILGKEQILPVKLLTVHDDADIFFGKFKLSFGSRSAGHRGAESVIQALGTKDFWRLRIGIQPASSGAEGPVGAPRHVRADDLVLKPFSPAEEAELPRIIEAAVGAIEAWVEKNS